MTNYSSDNLRHALSRLCLEPGLRIGNALTAKGRHIIDRVTLTGGQVVDFHQVIHPTTGASLESWQTYASPLPLLLLLAAAKPRGAKPKRTGRKAA